MCLTMRTASDSAIHVPSLPDRAASVSSEMKVPDIYKTHPMALTLSLFYRLSFV